MSTDDSPLFLFDVAAPPAAPADAAPTGPVQCSECPRMLTSKKSIEAGIGPGCAAKLGRVVSIAQRRSRNRKRRRQGAAAA